MTNHVLTEDTKAIILLCGVFGKERSVRSLSIAEYSSLVRWLIQVKMRPGDLLQKENSTAASLGSGIDKQRLESLLGRGVLLGFAVEEWQRNGIWIISRSDTDYPVRYKKHLKDKAPPLLFGVGDRTLLKGGGLGMVGSRNVDQAGESFACQVAQFCANNRMPVVSGGARGVDQVSMTAAIEACGVTIGILADNLLKKSLERSARHAIADGRLLLLSPYHPSARFTVGTAMARNKLIYAMADYGLVVSAEHKKGGTWAGAQEELKRENSLPVFVRINKDAPHGNNKLLDLGAIPWPEFIDQNRLNQQLSELVANKSAKQSKKNLSLFDFQEPQEPILEKEDKSATKVVQHEKTEHESEINQEDFPNSVYHAVLPVILANLDKPTTVEELAKSLDVNKVQLHAWLKKALDENKLKKLSKPVRFQKEDLVSQMKPEHASLPRST